MPKTLKLTEHNKLNNAMILPYRNHTPVYDFEEVPGIKCINPNYKVWKGRCLPHPQQKDDMFNIVYFVRFYEPSKNELDVYYPEYIIDDLSIIGVPVLLVPMEKILFGYEPSSVIVKPPVSIRRAMRKRPQ